MSSIDNRIVQMQFENSQFEKGVKQSLKSLDDLEKKLQFETAERGLQALQKVGDSFSLAKMAQGIEQVSSKFNALGVIGKRVLEDLTDKAIRMGEQFIKSVSIDQISAGWSKYNNKVQAVQTIMSATGKDIEYVDEQLSRLAWFTDETSYNFVDMASNIGKFTSMGVDLETSVTAMEGIATWAAVSGANASEASRAMYNMSQAMGVGSVKLMDWKSIENANMATKEFKQTAIDTAKALGLLNSEGKTAKGTAVTYENFAQTLNEGWFTSDVLIKTLGKYGEYADEVYTIATEKGISAAEAMELVSNNSMELGEKAFKAAQEAKTFEDAINSVKDAVSTGWMNIFEQIFGNYEEAKVLWTDLANYLWDMFAAPLSDTVDLLSEWKDLGGRTKALEGIYAIFEAIADIVNTVKDAIASVFPELSADRLYEISEGIADFGKQFKLAFGRYEVEGKTVVKTEKEIDKWIDTINNGYGKERVKAIRAVQTELVKLGYLSEEDYVSGLWGPNTQRALEDYQNGVKKTAEVLETDLKLGDRGDEVAEFQQKLSELGFDPGAIDGIWGKKTQAAYDAYIASLDNTLTEYKELKRGMQSEDVRALQFKLIEAGYLDAGQADGIFGPKTEEALKKWQKAKNLVDTGIFNEASYNAMYPEAVESAGESTEYATYTIVDYSDKMQNLYYITQGLASALHILTSFFGFVGKVIVHVGTLLSPLIDAFIAIAAALGNSITAFDQWLQEAGIFDKWFENVKTFLEPFGQWVQKAADGLLAFFGITKNAKDSNGELMTFAKLWNNIKEAIEKTGIIDKINAAWDKFTEALDRVRSALSKTGKSVKESVGKGFSGFFSRLPDIIASVVEWLGKLASDGLGLITPWIEKIPSAVEKIKSFWGALTQEGDSSGNKAPGFLVKVRDGFRSVIDFLFGEGDVTKGKRPGIFRKLGKLITGDLEGFTEGMDEGTKDKILNAIQSIKDFVQKVREGIVYLFTGNLDDDHKISDEAIARIDAFKNAIGRIIEAVALLFTGNVKEDSKLSDKTIKKILAIRATISGVFGVIADTVSKIFKTISGIFTGEIKFDSIGDFLSKLWEGVKDFFSQISGIASENIGSAWDNVKTFFTNLWDFAKSIGKWLLIGFIAYKIISLISNISGITYKIKEVIGSFKQNTQALSKTVLEFAAAIGIIAVSIWLVGQLDEDQFARGVGAIAGIFIAIGILLGICATFKGGKQAIKNLGKLGRAVMELAIGIGVIALAIVVLGALVPWDVFLDGLGKVAIIMVALIGFMWILKRTSGDMDIKLKGFYQIAIVIGALSLIAYLLGKADPGKLWRGIGALAAIMLLLAGLIFVMGKVGGTKIKLKGFIGLSVVVGILAIIAHLLGKADPGKLWRGIGALAAIMALMAGLVFVLGKYGKELKVGKLLVLFGGMIAVIAMFGLVIYKLKDVDPNLLYAFSISLAAAIVAFVAACVAMDKLDISMTDMWKASAGIGGAIAILVLIAAAIVYGIGKLDEAQPGVIDRGKNALQTIGEALSGFAGALNLSGEGVTAILACDFMVGYIEGGWKKMLAGAIGIGGALILLAAALVGIVYGAGKLEAADPGKIDKGKQVLQTVGDALSGFAGALGLTGDEIALILACDFMVGYIEGGWKKMLTGAFAIGVSLILLAAALVGIVYGAGKLDAAKPGTIRRGKKTLTNVAEALTGFADALGLTGDEIAAILAASFVTGLIGEGKGALYLLAGSASLAASISAIIAILTTMVTVIGLIDQASDGGLIDSVKRGKEAITQAGEAIGAFINGIKVGIFGEKVDPDALATDKVKAFGTAFQVFAQAVSGFSEDTKFDEDLTSATETVENLYTFFEALAQKLPDGSALTKYNAQIDSVLGDVALFGTSMEQVRIGIGGISSTEIEADVDAAIIAATAIADFVAGLSEQSNVIERNRTEFQKFFAGDTIQNTVFDNIKTFASSINEARSSLRGIGSGTFSKDMTDAITAISKIIGVIVVLKEKGLTSADWSPQGLDVVLTALNDISDQILAFNLKLTTNGVSEAAMASIGEMLSSVATFMEILSGKEGNRLSTENFLSGLDLESVTKQLGEFSSYLGTALQEAIDNVTSYSAAFSQAGIDLSASLQSGIANANIDGVGALVVKILLNTKNYTETFKALGGNFSIGLANGITAKAQSVINAAKAVATAALIAVKSVFNSHSPSKETMLLGNYFTDGLAKGTEDKIGEASNAASTVAESMLNMASGTLASLSEILAEDIDMDPVITPVVDLTNARASAAMIGGLFADQSFGVRSQDIARSAQISTNNGRPVTIQNGTINTTEAMDSVNEKLNALSMALNSRNEGPHTDPMETLGNKFGELADAVTHLKIVLDSGVLVGEISNPMDYSLDAIATRKDRGN